MTDSDLNSMSSDSAMLNQQKFKGPIHQEDHRYDQLEIQDQMQGRLLRQRELQPQQQQRDETRTIHRITPMLSYKELAERINNKTYDRSVFVSWKKSNSESMEKIISSLNSLNNMLEGNVLTVDYDTVKKAYISLGDGCLTYLQTHNPITDEGKARLDLVQKIYDRAMLDRHNLDVNAGQLKESEKGSDLTWKYLIADHAVFHIPKSQIKVPEGQELSGSSTVTKLVGEKTYYLKNQEVLPDTQNVPALKKRLKEEYLHELQELDSISSERFGRMDPEQKERKREELTNLLNLMERLDMWIDAHSSDTMAMMSENNWESLMKDPDCISAYKLTVEDKKYFLAFTRELSKKIVQYRAGKEDAKIPPGSVLDVRNEATSVLAETLGISDLIMESRTMDVEIEGEQRQVLRMEQVFGINGYSDMSKAEYLGKSVHMTPKALKQFQSLQIFDVICGQVDRNYNNVLLQTRQEGDKIFIDSIKGIDNDLAFGMLTYNDITFKINRMGQAVKRGYLNPIEDPQHKTYLAGVDKAFADKIIELKPDMLKYILGPYISKEEIMACQDRLKGVQEHLKSLQSRDKKKAPKDRFMITSDEVWADRLKGIVSPGEGLDEKTKTAHGQYVERLTKHSLIMSHYLGEKMERFPDNYSWEAYKEEQRKAQAAANPQGQQ